MRIGAEFRPLVFVVSVTFSLIGLLGPLRSATAADLESPCPGGESLKVFHAYSECLVNPETGESEWFVVTDEYYACPRDDGGATTRRFRVSEEPTGQPCDAPAPAPDTAIRELGAGDISPQEAGEIIIRKCINGYWHEMTFQRHRTLAGEVRISKPAKEVRRTDVPCDRDPPPVRISAVPAPREEGAFVGRTGEPGSLAGVVVARREQPRAADDEDLLLKTPATVASVPVDTIQVDLGDEGKAGAASPSHVPAGWSLEAEGEAVTLSGPPVTDAEDSYARIDLGSESPPERVGLRLAGLDALLYEGEHDVTRLPPLPSVESPDELVGLPGVVSPGETISFQPLDPERTPAADARWLVSGKPAREVDGESGDADVGPDGEADDDPGDDPGDRPEGEPDADPEDRPDDEPEDRPGYEVTLPLELEATVTLSYGTDWDEWAFRDVPVDGTEVVPAPEQEPVVPRITGCQPMGFAGQPACVCGWFPDDESRGSLTIDGRPLGWPLAAANRSVTVRLPGELEPGTHVIAGEGLEGTAKIVVVAIGGEIDRDKLLSGESTPLRLFVHGTEEPVELRLTNHTPEIITLEGGNDQVVTTSGGPNNTYEGMVHAGTPGNFNLSYELRAAACPCGEEEILHSAELEPKDGSIFDDTVGSFRDGRQKAQEAYYEDLDPADARDRAEEALEDLKTARDRLEEGIAAWDEGDVEGGIGPQAASSLRRFIAEVEDLALTVLEETPVPEPPPAPEPGEPGQPESEPTEPEPGEEVPEPSTGGPVTTSEGGGSTTAVESDDRDTGDDPGDRTPPPSEEEPPVSRPPEQCRTVDLEGRFEPSQGVFQDDPEFVDSRNPQLVQRSPRSFRAELPMVKDRQTVLIGTARPEGGPPEPRRDEIFMRGRSNGTVPVPVKMRFTLKQGGATTWSHTTYRPVGTVPLDPPCQPGAATRWEVVKPARYGVPSDPFQFESTGEYLLELELVRTDGTPTGLKVAVFGTVVETSAFRIAFRPVVLLSASLTPRVRQEFLDANRELADETRPLLQDDWPVAQVSGGSPFQVDVLPILDISSEVHRLIRNSTRLELGDRIQDVVLAELTRQMQARGMLAGYDRTVATLDRSDWSLLEYGELLSREDVDIAGRALSQKVVQIDLFEGITSDGGDHLVSHELIHTIEYLFSDTAMGELCGREYHGDPNRQLAYGLSITREGRNRIIGIPRRGVDGIMEYGDWEEDWTTQCTYWNLLTQLTGGPPDPPIVMVQGFARRTADGHAGLLRPLYQFDSVPDLQAAESPSDEVEGWSIVLRDGDGAELARYPFVPRWSAPEDLERDLIGFAYRVPEPPSTRRVELRAPDGELVDARDYSEHAPGVTITSPVPEPSTGEAEIPGDAERVDLEWEASDADGDPLLSTVLYSADGGETWRDVAFEIEGTSAEVPLEEGDREHRILVRVTDGSRSTDATLSIRDP